MTLDRGILRAMSDPRAGAPETRDDPHAEVAEQAARETPPAEPRSAREEMLNSPAASAGVPFWAVVPPGFSPPIGRSPVFLRVPSVWTDAPKQGIKLPVFDPERDPMARVYGPDALWRQAVLWVNSYGDRMIAYRRAKGDPNQARDELVKQTIRVIDGVFVDWAGADVGAGVLALWWDQVGEPFRATLGQMYERLHQFDERQKKLFFAYCVEARSSAG